MSGKDDGESSTSELVDFYENCDSLDNEVLEERKKLRALKLGFEPQKEIVYNKQLPYSGKNSTVARCCVQFKKFK